MASKNRTRIQVTNRQKFEVEFVLEPWGEIYRMPPEATFEVVASGPTSGCLEIEYEDKQVFVYGWGGATVDVFHEGQPLRPGSMLSVKPESVPAARAS